MITKEQEEWINTLSDKIISIVPYDPRSNEIFARIKNRISKVLGPLVKVEHSGASGLSISGQNEIDISILADKNVLEDFVSKLEKEFGPVKHRFPGRARFSFKEDDKKMDVQVLDVEHPSYKDSVTFEKYLRQNPEYLKKYRILKESCNGVAIKEYYRKKIEFINEILERVNRGK